MEKIISELRHRAWQERAAASIGRTSQQRTAEAEHAARALESYANYLESEATPAPTTRTVQWGHNGITFLDGKIIIGQAWFPTGPQGPIDGTIGSKERKHWEDVCAAWKERGELPKVATVKITTGISEAEQQSAFQNATLQGSGVAFSIATFLRIPDDIAAQKVEQFIQQALQRAANAVDGLSFEVQIGPEKQTDWTVYKTEDDTFPVTHHATQAEAEARIVEIEQTDPAGVHNGDYGIDGPTE